jgi:hypothetical protein
MNRLTRISRLAVAATLGGAIALPVPPVHAQDAAPPPPADAQAAQPTAGGDPPVRAGRVARLSGTVSFHGPGADHWDTATLNFPVTTGDALWTEPQGSAAVDISASRITLDGGTEFDIEALDAQALTATAPQGELFLRLRHLAPGENFTLRTPRGSVSIAAAGRYEIAAGDTQAPTTVTVVEGTAQVSAENLALTVQAGQTATITGDQTFQGSVGPQVSDAFLTAMIGQPTPVAAPAPVAQAAPPPPAVAAMPGSEDLDQYGGWQPTPQYGSVWYPQVAAGWVPYRDGHWAYVAPWGWTWVDNEPWGFAPFHYGRWVEVNDRWGWAPVYSAPGYVEPAYAEPVYAPALVSFVGFGVGVAIGAAIGGSVGWFPLGWNEPYRPWYHYSPGYMQNVNRTYVSNVTNITNVTNISYANRNVTTVVPGSVMVNSRPVAPAVMRLSPQQVAGLHPAPLPPVRPTATTAGVTPVVARQLHLPAAPAAPGRPLAPGPAFAPTPVAARAAAAVPLRPPGAAPAVRAGVTAAPLAPTAPHANAAPGPAIAPRQPGVVTPGLRAPGAPAAAAGRLPPVVHPQAGGATPRASAAPGPTIVPRAAGAAVPALRPAVAAHGPAAPRPGEAPLTTHAAPGSMPPRPQTVAPQIHAAPAPSLPRASQVAPPAHEAPARPASAVREAPRPAAVVHEAPRPAPVAHEAPRPAPVVHEAPRPAPVIHEAPRPAPVVHEAARPAPAPRPAAPVARCEPKPGHSC